MTKLLMTISGDDSQRDFLKPPSRLLRGGRPRPDSRTWQGAKGGKDDFPLYSGNIKQSVESWDWTELAGSAGRSRTYIRSSSTQSQTYWKSSQDRSWSPPVGPGPTYRQSGSPGNLPTYPSTTHHPFMGIFQLPPFSCPCCHMVYVDLWDMLQKFCFHVKHSMSVAHGSLFAKFSFAC